jgi:uncharacterized protein YabE (DUF348 family)
MLPQALVVAFLAGGTAAFVTGSKTITLDVDGHERGVNTFADSVGEVLDAGHVHVGPHDSVSPALDATVGDDDEITVRHARRLTLTVDGRRHRVWTTGSVTDALRRLGVAHDRAYVSASRGGSRDELEVRTERTVTFLADGAKHTVRTRAATVEDALREAGLELHGHDGLSAAAGSLPRDGQVIKVMRIEERTVVRREPIPFETVRRADGALSGGVRVVERAGSAGMREVTYRIRTVNGVRQAPDRIRSEVVREAREQIIRLGAGAVVSDRLNWTALARCESGGRSGAVDSTGLYGGLYQFDTRTWQAIGGSGRPQDAPAAEQTYRAKRLYVQRGAAPWPVCGRNLYR